jgi:hypothetical protein
MNSAPEEKSSTSTRVNRLLVVVLTALAWLAPQHFAAAQAAPEPTAEPAAVAPTESEPAAVAPTEAAPAPAPASAPAPEPAMAAPAAAEPMPAPPTDAAPAAAPSKPPPYSLPFQLRPAVAASVLRSDTAFAFYKDPVSGKSGTTIPSMLLFSYKLSDNFAPMVRLGVVSNSAPSGTSGFGFLNPVLGATYALKPTPELRLAMFLGVTIPVGSGGGDKPDLKQKAARAAGIPARSAMDNAMFAVNDFTIFPGVDLAYVKDGFTAQVELTLFQLTRVRGAKDQPDSAKTNFTAGLHLGYFFIPELSAAVELRHQRWLSTPKQVAADPTGSLRDNTTVAFGPRVHLKLNETMWLRPGVSLAFALDDPMKKSSYKIVQLDIPFAF